LLFSFFFSFLEWPQCKLQKHRALISSFSQLRQHFGHYCLWFYLRIPN
jgi:hypothetical protein